MSEFWFGFSIGIASGIVLACLLFAWLVDRIMPDRPTVITKEDSAAGYQPRITGDTSVVPPRGGSASVPAPASIVKILHGRTDQ